MKKLSVKSFISILVIILTSVIFLNSSEKSAQKKYWLDSSTPSIKETYSKYFDSFGIACEYGNWGKGWGTKGEFTYEEVQKGLKKHSDIMRICTSLCTCGLHPCGTGHCGLCLQGKCRNHQRGTWLRTS